MFKKFFLWILLPGIVLSMVYQMGFRAGLEKAAAGNLESPVPRHADRYSKTTIVPASADLPQDKPVKIAKPKTHPKLISTDNTPAGSPASAQRSTNPSDFYAPRRSVYDRPAKTEELTPLMPLDR
ncbi:MAG: hypothetical protein LBH00_10545 [Planctomycetaceae bacterium]|nr:hypothetical protein [Planctomycetaceae bacterium]